MTDKRLGRERIHAALREYVDLGLPVIPLCSHDHEGFSENHVATCKQAGKIPLIKGWREHETTTKDQVVSWIREFRNLNIGLPLGKKSGYIGIDVDGDLGEDMLEEMSDGDLPQTWEFITGDGRRLLYAIPVGMETKKYVNPHQDGGHEEASILCDGQQTVMPPSIHHTGRLYEWLPGHSPRDIDIAQAPNWLLDLVRADRDGRPAKASKGKHADMELDLADEDEVETTQVNPLIISDDLLPSEFMEYIDLEIDTTPPDTDYVGKNAKGQEKEDDNRVSTQELMQKITAGNRDNQMTRIIGSFCAQFRALGKDYIMVMAKNHNQQFCDPPLDNYAIEAKVNHFWETEQMKSAQYRKGGGEGEEKKRFAPSVIAEAAINLLVEQGYVLKVDAEHPIVWMTKKTEGPWTPLDSRSGTFFGLIREAMSDPEKGGDAAWTTVRHYKDVANSFVVDLRMAGRIWESSSADLDTQTLTNYKYIPLIGGKLLDWRTGELHPWDPETNLTYVLPVEYDPTAKCPAWEKRLGEWLPDEGSRLILQEFIGYSLIPYMGFEKALVIQGEGANGKSLFLETIQGLLGYKVVDSINMRNLFSRFGQADLVGKILNIVNEAGSEYLRGGSADDFKNLVSGGRIKADIKNMAPITFNNTAKFIFASNHDVKTGDKSEGWLRRMLLVPFDQDFRHSQVPKYEIMEELRREYSGIFNWAITGLRRLMQNQAFSDSESARIKKEAYMRENDITADFYMNCLETFQIAVASPDNPRPPKPGTPSALINYMFGLWVEYRESTVQKKTDHITKYLEKKHGLHKARTQHTLMVKKVMTECWIGIRVNIRDTAFLDLIANEAYTKFPELKEYAIKRLKEIDEELGRVDSGQPSNHNVKELPNTQAN